MKMCDILFAIQNFCRIEKIVHNPSVTESHKNSMTVCDSMNWCLLWSVLTRMKVYEYGESFHLVQVLTCVQIVSGGEIISGRN